MINVQDINKTVSEFQNTVQALKRIETICAETDRQYTALQEIITDIEDSTERVYEASAKMSETAKSLTKCTNEGTEKLVSACKSNNNSINLLTNSFKSESQKTLSSLENTKKETVEQINRCTKALDKTTETVLENMRKYTLSTQGAIEDLRIGQNQMASELRKNAVKNTQAIKNEIDSISEKIQLLSETLSIVVIAQQKTQKILIAATAFAAIASIFSIMGMLL